MLLIPILVSKHVETAVMICDDWQVHQHLTAIASDKLEVLGDLSAKRSCQLGKADTAQQWAILLREHIGGYALNDITDIACLIQYQGM